MSNTLHPPVLRSWTRSASKAMLALGAALALVLVLGLATASSASAQSLTEQGMTLTPDAPTPPTVASGAASAPAKAASAAVSPAAKPSMPNGGPAPAFLDASLRPFSQIDVMLLVMGSALVFFMQAGFALLESGLSRSKNAVNVLLKNYLDMVFGGLAFWAIGYGLMFGFNRTGLYGMDMFFFTPEKEGDYLYFLFQVMFCSTAATIVSGAIAERTRIGGYVVGSIFISAIIYPVFGSWVWGGWHGGYGWLADFGYIDFAGSSVVHMVGGWCALAALIVVRPRLGRFGRKGVVHRIPGHNLSSAALGALILWLGWFGFNGSSIAVSAAGTDASLGRILVNTHLSAIAGVAGAVLAMRMANMKINLSMSLNGGIAGLVAITAGCHVMDPIFALVTGLIAGLLVKWADWALLKMRIDDVVSAVPVHLVCGIWGTIAAGMFNAKAFMSLSGIMVQVVGVAAGSVWAFVMALLMYAVISRLMGLRVNAMDEQRGLDYAEHDELCYPEFQDVMHQNQERQDRLGA